MNAQIQYVGGARFDVAIRGHRIIADLPVESGGQDSGATPPELLLASLGACAGLYAAEFLRDHKLPVEGLSLQVFADQGSHPAHLEFFRLEVTIPNLDRQHREGVINAVKRCLIRNTLRMSPAVDVQVNVVNAGEEVVSAG